MAEQSFVLDMTLVETFWDNWNKTGWYGADSMVKNISSYEIVLADSSSTNPLNDITDALENGALKSTVNVHDTNGDVFLLYTGESGTWERTIQFDADCTVVIGDDNIYIKGVFLREANTIKVLAYCILSNRMPITNRIIIPKDTISWRIRENVRYGE